MKRPLVNAAASMAFALAAAACGGGASSANGATGTSGTSVGVTSSQFGQVLDDSHGRTLYLFEADSGATSTCYNTCAAIWPPLTTAGKPQAAKGATGSALGTTARSNGKTQVTYNGHPLYYYAGDGKPGDATGQALDQFGAKWYVLSPAGDKIDNG